MSTSSLTLTDLNELAVESLQPDYDHYFAVTHESPGQYCDYANIEINEEFDWESTDLRRDIRHLEEYTMASFDSTTSIIVDNTIYYIQQEWDIMIDTDQNISSLPFGEDNVKLEFNFVNQIPNSEDFTKIF